jgi:ferritin-like metal-binding protein YciE
LTLARDLQKEGTMATKNLEELFIDELKDLYDAEKRVLRSLPKLIKGSETQELRSALTEHLEQTRTHVERLETVFGELDKAPVRKTCKAMTGLLAEAEELLEVTGESAVNDAAIIAAGRKVEHYEMATYGTLHDWANQLGLEKVAGILQTTWDEEAKADKRLCKITQGLEFNVSERAGAKG